MGLFGKLLGADRMPAIEVKAERNTLYLPIEGEVIPLEKIGDGVFSAGILGKGCGILPAEEMVYAPANARVSQVADTKHAIGLMSEDGVEMLIHVGMDTVEMKGDGFTVLVEQGQKVKCGQPLMKFSIDKIRASGHPITTAFVITNTDDLSRVTVLDTGTMKKMTAVMRTD